MPSPRFIDFRVSHSVPHGCQTLGSVRYRAGFEDWDDPGAFVVQLEEAIGYSQNREAVDWSPIARFDHLRPHDVFDLDEGVHLDVYRRDGPRDSYVSIALGSYPSEQNPKALCFNLQQVFRTPSNVTVLLEYYTGKRPSLEGGEIRFPE